MSVDERWNKVLAALPAIGKNSRNTQQGFNYRSIDDVLDRVNPLFAEHGVHPVPVRQIAEREQRATAKGSLLNVCYITVDWEIRSVDGDTMFAQTLGEGTDMGDKATSKAQTMAFKYLLWPSLAIATNEDPDGTTVEESVRPVHTAEPRSLPGAVPIQEYESVNDEQIPLTPAVHTTRSAPPPSPDDVCSPKQSSYLKSLLEASGVAESEWPGIVNSLAPPWPDSLRNLSKKQASVLIDAYKV